MSTKRRKVKADTTVAVLDDGELAVWTLPRTAEAYDAMHAQIDAAITKAINQWFSGSKSACDHAPAATLRAIGITRPKEDSK